VPERWATSFRDAAAEAQQTARLRWAILDAAASTGARRSGDRSAGVFAGWIERRVWPNSGLVTLHAIDPTPPAGEYAEVEYAALPVEVSVFI
jgi:hypothetical protein